MNINDLISPDRVECNLNASSKKRALEQLSDLLARSSGNLSAEEIFESLVERERLGSTGLGHGVAIPHARLTGREEATGAFIKLNHGVDFDAVDKQPADLLFALLVPEHFTDEHLEILSELARIFDNEKFRRQLRDATDPVQIYDLLSHSQDDASAA